MLSRTVLLCVFLLMFWLPSQATRAVMFLSNDPSPKDKWHYTILNEPLEYSKVEAVYPDQPFHLLIFLAEYATNSQGKALLTYDLEVIDPLGNVVFGEDELTALDGQVKGSNPILISENTLKIALKPSFPLGRYEIHVRITDWIDNTYQELEETVDFQSFSYQPYFDKVDAVFEWQNNYYNNPRPEMALDAFLHIARTDLTQEEINYHPLLYFYSEIFTYNPFLIRELARIYPELDEKLRFKALELLHYSGFDEAIFYQNLPDLEARYYHSIKTKELKMPVTYAFTPGELDILWYHFLATGNFKSIQRIVATLDLAPEEPATHRSQRDRAAEDMQEALYEGVTRLAWVTLVTQGDEHRLVKDYCRFMYRYTKQTDNQKLKMEELLGY